MDALNLALFEPAAHWLPPKRFPNLSGVKRICLDLETKDPNLEEKGPGRFRGDGYPVGIALAVDDASWYFPIRHLSGGNMDEENVVRFISDIVKKPEVEVVGANTIYDLEWLDYLGIEVMGPVRDVQIAEALMDEEQDSYALNTLCKKYLGETKDESLLREAASAYGVDPKKELWKLHSKYVGGYAQGDAAKTLRVFDKQLPLMEKQGLIPIFNLESRVTPIIWRMRKHGVRIDLEAADTLSRKLKDREDKLRMTLKGMVGYHMDVGSGDQIGSYCDQKGIAYGRTEAGNPSFDKNFLKNNSHEPFFKLIRDIRSTTKLRKDYVDGIVLKWAIDGRVHCEFHQIKGDEDGTITGRFSCSCPNLQQIPARDKEVAPLIRALFIADEGEDWAKLDYSQQEPRLITHFAYVSKFRGADKVLQAYREDKESDFYMLVAKEAQLERKPAKDLTLGRCYGEGKDKMARDLGVSVDEAKRVLETFDAANPFIKDLQEAVANKAEQRGFIKTLLGRHQHFNFWEPADWRKNPYKEHHRLEAAERRWPGMRLRRAFLYKALNKLIQGSAADMTKAAMVKVYDEMKRIPLLTVHDELDYSVPDKPVACMIQWRMENCVDVVTPILAELDYGKHWVN